LTQTLILAQYVAEYEFRHNTRHITDEGRFNAFLENVSGRFDWYVGRLRRPDLLGGLGDRASVYQAL